MDDLIKENTAKDIKISADNLLDAISQPVFMVLPNGKYGYANVAAESFFQAGKNILFRSEVTEFIPFDSPVHSLIKQVQKHGSSVNEYGVDLGTPRGGKEHLVDIQASPILESPGCVLVMLQVRSMARKIDQQIVHRGSARAVTGLAAMLAHEIKNPLSGIRGAAQLLEGSIEASEKELTRLICDETDRVVKLVDRMEVFSDERPIHAEPVNIHAVLDRVKNIALNGFAKDITIKEIYDPSLPSIMGDQDQLIQVFLNLVKNAAEAVKENEGSSEIVLTTAFKPGIHLSLPGAADRVRLPLEVCITDNGRGVPEDILPHLFDPFVTSKISGSGLGLALVAKIIGNHGGVVECDSKPRKTIFRVYLPMEGPKKTKNKKGAVDKV